MTWKMRWVGIVIKKNHLFRIKTMKTNKHDNPTNIHGVNHDFVCPKENFEINLKIFHSDAPSVSSVFKCEFDNWSPNESMR
jgi:hypothetical protein